MRFVNPFIRVFLSRVVFCALLLGMTAGAPMLASDREKYLAAAGPTPIRLLIEAPRLNPMKALPRLRMSSAIEPVKAVQTIEASTREQVAGRIDVVTEPATANSEMNLIEPATNNETAPKQGPAAQVSPQMLLRYFSRSGTNEVLVPYSVDFTPPVPRRSGDSKAVYISQ
jgi:hypothetical protein